MCRFFADPALTAGLFVVAQQYQTGKVKYLSLSGFGVGRRGRWVENKESASHFTAADAEAYVRSFSKVTAGRPGRAQSSTDFCGAVHG